MDTTIAKRPHKIAIIGMGNIGRELLQRLKDRNAADEIVGWNRDKANEQDMLHGINFASDQANIADGLSHGYGVKPKLFCNHEKKENPPISSALSGADIVIITVGAKRTKENMGDRELLKKDNTLIIEQKAAEVAAAFKNSDSKPIVIIATNPLDSMTQLFQEKSGLPPENVIGLSGELDRTRLIQAIAKVVEVDHPQILNAQVFGQHGKHMVIPFSNIEIQYENIENPISLEEALARKGLDVKTALKHIEQETVNGGEKLVGLLGESDYRAPAAALDKMIMDIVEGREFAGSAHSAGLYTGRRVRSRSDRTIEVLPMEPVLSYPETIKFQKAEEACKDAMKELPGYKVGPAVAA